MELSVDRGTPGCRQPDFHTLLQVNQSAIEPVYA